MFNGDLTGKVMEGIADEDLQDKPCNCNVLTKKKDGSCLYDNCCRRSMIVYELRSKVSKNSYIGKTQDYLKKRTSDHFYDTWKLREAQIKGTSYIKTDAFAKHFVKLCQDCYTSNSVRARLKEVVEPTIIWQGDRIRCMKSSWTLQCKICMVERKEILHRLKTNKHLVINDNSDIYSSCKCGSRCHKFNRTITTTLRTRSTQKKAPLKRKSKLKRRRTSRTKMPETPNTNQYCQAITPESATSQFTQIRSSQLTPIHYDTNVPGLPYRSPSYIPTNLELAQFATYQTLLDNSAMEV